MSRGSVLGLSVLLGWLSVSSPGFAQTDDASRSAARDLATAGVEAFQHDNFADASAKLEKAYRVLKVPSFGLWSARALVKVGQWVKAAERYREVTHLAPGEGDAVVQKQAQADAQAELDALSPRIPRLIIKVEGASAEETTVKVDGVPISSALLGESRPTDPGTHVLEASHGAQTSKVEVTLAEGDTKDLLLKIAIEAGGGALAPARPAESAPASSPARPAAEPRLGTQRTVALVVAAVGVAGLGVGSVFGLRAKTKLDEADKAGCTAATCPTQPGVDANEAALTAGTISTVAFVVGAVGLAGGAVLWLTGAPEAQHTASVGIGPRGLQVRAVW